VRTKRPVIGGVLVVFAMATTSCSRNAGVDTDAGVARDGAEISQSDYDEQWPLTVNGGILRCEGESAITLEVNGKRYAVNSTAQASTAYAKVDEIRAGAPEGQGLKNLGPLIDRGLELC
jgi:hypothetical protein